MGEPGAPDLHARMAAAEAELALAMASDDFAHEIEVLLRLSELALEAKAPARALGWIDAAASRLATGRGGVQVRAQFERQRAQVSAAVPAGAVAEPVERPAVRVPSRAEVEAARGATAAAVAEAEARASAVEASRRAEADARWAEAIAAAEFDARARLLGERARARAAAGRREEAIADIEAAWAIGRAQGRRVAPAELLQVASALGVTLDTEDGGAALEEASRGAEASDAPRLAVGRSLSTLPDAFAYARDDGPRVPSRVHFVAAALGHRTTGAGAWLLLIVLGLALAGFGAMASMAWHRGNDFDAWVSLGLAAVSGGLGWLVAWRIRTARADARKRRLGVYRIGVYFDGPAMLWRDDAGWSLFPRERVEGVRVVSRYDSETKFTAHRAEVDYRDETGQRLVWRPAAPAIGIDASALVELIDRWRSGRPIHD